jgi:thioesterase domain-containing protein
VSSHARKDQLANLFFPQEGSTHVCSASLAQQRLWFLDQLQGRNSAYNVHLGLWLRGSLDLAALESSVREMVKRHDSLRTTFRLEGGKLQQVVRENYHASIPLADLSSVADPYAEAYQLARHEVEEPFDLSKAPLFRPRLLRVTDQDHVFICTMHHIVTDAWSLQVFAKELALLYSAFSKGEPSPLAPLPIRYGDFSEWQLEWFQTDAVRQELAYWKSKLEGAPPLLELPTDAPRPPEQTFEGASEITAVPSDIIEGIRAVAARCHSTPFIVQLAAFKLLLYRYTQQYDVLVGVPVAGRNRVETEGLMGFFVNTLVLRDDLSGNPRFTELVARVRETILGAFSNVDIPFEKIVEILQPKRNLSYNPIFQVMFATIKSAVRSHEFGDLVAFPYVVNTETSIFDLSMTLIEDIDEQWWAQIEYNTNLFKQPRISRMLGDYTSLLEAITGHPEAHILEFRVPSIPEPVGLLNQPSANKQANRNEKKTQFSSVAARETSGRLLGPVDQDQKFLVEVWKRILGLREVGIRDSFFDVGGHSLIAARLIAHINELTGHQIPVSAIFRAPTIEAFAPLLHDNTIPKADPVLMQLQVGDGIMPFFTVAAPGADTFGLSLLARHMGKDQSVYKVQGLEPIVWGRPFTKDELRSLAQQYVAAIRSAQPHGPYCVGGMCDGVLIAQEVVLELESLGEEVGVFAIFDTWVLENSQIRILWAIDYYWHRFQIFRALSREKQIATIKSIVRRPFVKNGNTRGTGWNRIYWPAEGFQEPRFRAPVVLFKRARQPFFYVDDPQMGWGGRSRRGVQICELNCEHDEFLRQPQVGIVGQVLAGRLQAVRASGTRSPSVFSVPKNY